MLDKKRSEKIITQLIRNGGITKPPRGSTEFFLAKSMESLQVSRRLFEISEDKQDSLQSYMWIITTSYYAMFFAATALLSSINKKLDVEAGIHKLTYHALVYYFLVANSKLREQFIDEYYESHMAAQVLLQMGEKSADEFVESFDHEQTKRKIFTYEMGKIPQHNKAKTSMARAEHFVKKIRILLNG